MRVEVTGTNAPNTPKSTYPLVMGVAYKGVLIECFDCLRPLCSVWNSMPCIVLWGVGCVGG